MITAKSSAARSEGLLPESAISAPIYAGSCADIGELLLTACLQHKTRVAVIEADRKREVSRLTYREFLAVAEGLAGALAEAGIGPGSRVAVVLTNQWRWLASAMAVFLRGATLVPLDYKLSAPELRALLAHAKPALLVTEQGFWRGLSGEGCPPTWLTDLPAEGEAGAGAVSWERMAAGPAQARGAHLVAQREAPACIVYSSGTGGAPKGCVLSHRAYLSQLTGLLELYPMAAGERFFSVLPTNHAIDFMTGFLGPFACGATVVHQRTLRPELLLWTLQRYQPTHMAAVPMLLTAFDRAVTEKLAERPGWQQVMVAGLAELNARWTTAAPSPALSRRLLAPVQQGFGGKLRLIFAGGAAVPRALVERLHALGLPVVVGYGLTEACTVLTVNDQRPFRADSVGRVVPGVSIRIDRPDAEGVGEVQASGPTLFSGYLEAPELTEAAFDGPWLRTGDLGYVDAAGHLVLVGRSKDMIVTPGGKNIYPEDIVARFAEVDCEELEIFAENALWPRRELQGERLVAVVRAEGDLGAVRATLRRVNLGLPDYKRISGVVFVKKAFPRTATMKVKRAELAELLRTQLGRDAVEAL